MHSDYRNSFDDRPGADGQGDRSESSQQVLTAPPPALLQGASLFLDLDGTLLDLIDDPDAVVADDGLRALLRRLSDRLDGRLAIISGRSLAQIGKLLGSVADHLVLSGSHGCEFSTNGTVTSLPRPAALDEAGFRFHAFHAGREGMFVEEKSLGVGLHYRRAPGVEPEARALAKDLATELGLMVQLGKAMVELRVPGGDKGFAIHHLMASAPMAGTLPVFAGDDVTDEAGFVAARELGGAGILVGGHFSTSALYTLPDPAAVRRWLADFAA